ncbi:TRAP transporter substrate-binding protein [Anaerotruncus rubiinfantis]|uniref:TRAP transporter substrate-binding protein n=1 Tax=Anaerotruncus rubiinfantis TaxID=1720200 RepID=UPI00082CBA68|nr:TRAP transporter substrate-binding protein [Anaerotruncus rubiinfantis]
MKKRILSLVLAAVMVLAFAACGSSSGNSTAPAASGAPAPAESKDAAPADSGEVIELSFGHIQNPGHALAIAPEEFKQFVEEKTNGRVKITIFPSSQLGTQREMIEQTVMGTLDINFSSVAELSTGLNKPIIGAFELPFLSKDLKTQERLINEVVMPELPKLLEGTGLKMLNCYSNGIRQPILKTRPITKLDDLKGLKMRCAETPLYVNLWTSLGCTVVTSPWSEAYTVVQQGVADAAEADAVGLVNVNLQEVSNYYSRMGHIGAIYPTYINEEKWNSIPADLQEIIMECAAESQAKQIADRQGLDDIAEKAIADAGVEINDVPDEERAKMRAACQKMYDDFAAENNCQELIDKLLAIDA